MKLADAACPDWARVPGRCTVFISALDGVALGATVMVTPAAETASAVVRQLTKEYGKAPSPGENGKCVNGLGVEVSRAAAQYWKLSGLSVEFDPLGVDCRQGIVKVELDTLRKLRAEEEAAREASGPKM